ncbi:hypothetical protein AGMMS49944_03930 [Spirochaetia bacterium]|nr:hypothetical protein AGMMS49944_03930 [Spirochaetia bacterium]
MIEPGEKPIRGFYQSHKAWYAESNGIKLPEIMFGIYWKNDGTEGEMAMRWIDLCNETVPQLEVYRDAWKVLNDFKDVLDDLAAVNDINITDDQFVEILKKRGFRDLTNYDDDKREGRF